MVLWPLILSDKKLSIGDLLVDYNRTVSLIALETLEITQYETSNMKGMSKARYGITTITTTID